MMPLQLKRRYYLEIFFLLLTTTTLFLVKAKMAEWSPQPTYQKFSQLLNVTMHLFANYVAN